jgi:hypothetical protein
MPRVCSSSLHDLRHRKCSGGCFKKPSSTLDVQAVFADHVRHPPFGQTRIGTIGVTR